jgi:NADP-dependent 3-hydroxy acid dehydrogenase YdfG
VKEFKGKVAVVTGAGNGIGAALAHKCADEGMKVVLAGINLDNLKRVENELKAKNATVISVKTDVSKADEVENLAKESYAAFGAVDLLINNAGVYASIGVDAWDATLQDWQWVLGVNLYGVINGIKSFVPKMLGQDTEGHIVNVASIAGLISSPGGSVYRASKHAAVSLSESLFLDLIQAKSKIGVSVICPSFVKTKLVDSERSRPAELQNDPSSFKRNEAKEQKTRQNVEEGISAEELAETTFKAIIDEQFYVLSKESDLPVIRVRTDNIANLRNPYDSHVAALQGSSVESK